MHALTVWALISFGFLAGFLVAGALHTGGRPRLRLRAPESEKLEPQLQATAAEPARLQIWCDECAAWVFLDDDAHAALRHRISAIYEDGTVTAFDPASPPPHRPADLSPLDVEHGLLVRIGLPAEPAASPPAVAGKARSAKLWA